MSSLKSENEQLLICVEQLLGSQFRETREEEALGVIHERLRETGCDPHVYLDRLTSARGGREELRELARRLTVGETYFFRHPDQLEAFAEEVMPELLESRRAVRVLSAGSSSGDEAHSLVILALERGYPLKVVGVDINPESVKKASAGVYTDWGLRATSEQRRQLYFKRQGRSWALNPDVRRCAVFQEGNLTDPRDKVFCEEPFDVIFCRNVSIYFSEPTIRVLMRSLTEILSPGGFIFFGTAETLRGVSDQYHLRQSRGSFFYQKRGSSEPRGSWEPSASWEPRASWEPSASAARSSEPRFAGTTTGERTEPDAPAWHEKVAGAHAKIAALGARSQKVGTPAPTKPTVPIEKNAPPALGGEVQFRRLLVEQRDAEAAALYRTLPRATQEQPDLRVLWVVALSNTGDRAEASQVLEELLKAQEFNPVVHYLAALACEAAGEFEQALERGMAAAYLDPGFALAQLLLGRVLMQTGESARARRCLESAQALLNFSDPEALRLLGGGFDREQLAGVCRSALNRLGKEPA